MRSYLQSLPDVAPVHLSDVVERRQSGVVRSSVGLTLEIEGLHVGLGQTVLIASDERRVPAQVIGFRNQRTFLMPLAPTEGLRAGAKVTLADDQLSVDPTHAVGRVLSARGEPMDGGRPLPVSERSVDNPRINPLARPTIDEAMDLGVRSINTLLTVGRGQRLGLFAGSGVGKSVLLGMLARNAEADVVVVGLIGERGREVKEFIEDNLGDGLSHAVVVASPADDSPALRLRGAWFATEIAEAYRRQGKNVLLLLDSLTRCAQAQREIGLAMGEPATTKGYPPSAFALLPNLVERAGRTNEGSITAFYTVLMEEDDLQDPVVDAARAILDGHIVLDRQLADQGVFPAVNVARSVSRVMPRLAAADELAAATEFRALWARYEEQSDLISIGAYQAGVDPLTDRAIQLHQAQLAFVRQGANEAIGMTQARSELNALLKGEALPAPLAAGEGVSAQT